MKISKLSVLFILLLMVACGPIILAPVTQADVERGKNRYKDLTVSDLEKGKALCEKMCVSCHKMKSPKSKTEKQWRQIIPSMARHAMKKAGGKVVIDDSSQVLIYKYLVTVGPLTKDKSIK